MAVAGLFRSVRGSRRSRLTVPTATAPAAAAPAVAAILASVILVVPVPVPFPATATANATGRVVLLVLFVLVEGGAIVLVFVLFVFESFEVLIRRNVGLQRLAWREDIGGPGLVGGPLDVVAGMGKRFVDNHRHEDALVRVQPGQMPPLLVQDVQGDGAGRPKHDLAGALQGFHFHRPEGAERTRLHRPDASGSRAVLTDMGRTLEQAGASALPRQLHQTEA